MYIHVSYTNTSHHCLQTSLKFGACSPSMGDFGSLAEVRKRKEQHTGLQGLNNTAVYSNLHWIPVCREECLATCMWPHKI